MSCAWWRVISGSGCLGLEYIRTRGPPQNLDPNSSVSLSTHLVRCTRPRLVCSYYVAVLRTRCELTTACRSPSNIVAIMPARKRCQHAGAPCPNAAVRIVGTCSRCSHHFCASVSRPPPLYWIAVADLGLQHRLPEQHACTKLTECKREAFETNRTKLESSRAVASKMEVVS